MTGEEILREVELRAEQRGEQRGEERGKKKGMRRMVRLAFERMFGPMPAILESALGEVTSTEELERMMGACLTRSRDKVEQMLGSRDHGPRSSQEFDRGRSES